MIAVCGAPMGLAVPMHSARLATRKVTTAARGTPFVVSGVHAVKSAVPRLNIQTSTFLRGTNVIPTAKFVPQLPERRRASVVVASSAAAAPSTGNSDMKETMITLGYIAVWYALNIGFNLQNKMILQSFPYPWTISTVHVLIGTVYCAVAYLIGFKKASFDRPVTQKEFKAIAGPATMHAIGHIASNVSFAAVAISLTHTVKTLEPVFNVVLSQIFMGTATPLPVIGSLVPIMIGVSLASAAELSFNWTGFLTAMLSNLTFGFRAVWSKQNMNDIKNLSSTGNYAWTTLISLCICLPLALIIEGPTLMQGIDKAVLKVGAQHFWSSLASVGLFYHLYNQFAFNTLSRVSPVSHGVCNVVKRVAIIATSVLFFGNQLTIQTKMGTLIAIAGTALYTKLTSNKAAKKQ